LDDSTFKQLKESKYYHPEITEVIFDSNRMLTIAADSARLVQDGYDMLWDSIMSRFISNYYVEGTKFVEQQAKEKGIKLRLVVEITKDNKDFINSLKYHEIRHLEGIRSDIGIFDRRAYMVAIFHKESIHPDQIFFSNSRSLVKQQRYLFDTLWDMATPLSIRNKELMHQEKQDYKGILTEYNQIQQEIISVLEQSRKELLIFSSIKLLDTVLDKVNIVNNLMPLLRRGVNIKILVDDINQDVLNQIIAISNKNKNELIQFGYTNKLGNFDEMVIISDNKYVLQIRYDQQNELVASFSNEEHSVWIQEIIFEKYWNEVNSLAVINKN